MVKWLFRWGAVDDLKKYKIEQKKYYFKILFHPQEQKQQPPAAT